MTVDTGRVGSRAYGALVTVGTSLVVLAFFFRFQIMDGFAHRFGDRYDAMIEVAILQHWANVFAGRAVWNVTNYFYPAPDTLGYNDAYFLSGVLYAGFRHLGLTLVAAAEAVHALLKIAGFFGMAWLIRTAARAPLRWCLFGATLFTIADLTLQHANHGQLFTLSLAPFAFALAWRAGEALLAGRRRALLINGAGLALLFAIWISTAFYLAWFFLFYGAIVACMLLRRFDRARWRGLGSAMRREWLILALLLAVACVSLVPFLIVYLPKSAETGMHAFAELRGSAFMPLDYFNAGPSNLLWHGPLDFLRRTIAPKLKTNPDNIFGFTPFLFAITIWAAIRLRRDMRESALAGLGLALLVSWALMFKAFGFVPWWLVYTLVPGAGGIRVIGRFNLLLLVPAILIVTDMLARSRRAPLAIAAAALLLAEQLSSRAPIDLDEAEQLAMIAAVPRAALAGRPSFYVVSARTYPYPVFSPDYDRIYAHNVDAMVLSEVLNVPTVNGFSTFEPPHWDFADPLAPDYDDRVRRYAAASGIAMPTRFDLGGGARPR